MANRTRRADPSRHPAEVLALLPRTPTGIRWHRNSWVARKRSSPGGEVLTRSFSTGRIGIAVAWQRALDWQSGLPVPPQYAGIDLARTNRRQLTLYRRVLKDRTWPRCRFELAIERSKGCHGPWLRIFLGSTETIAQDRIDQAVATLHLRMRLFRRGVRMGVPRRTLFAFLALVQARTSRPQSQLKLQDVRAWTGKGVGVSYAPRHSVDPDRWMTYVPELEQAIRESW